MVLSCGSVFYCWATVMTMSRIPDRKGTKVIVCPTLKRIKNEWGRHWPLFLWFHRLLGMYLYCLYKCSPEVLWNKEPFLPVQYKTHEMSPSLVWATVLGPHIVWSSSHSLVPGHHDSLLSHTMNVRKCGTENRGPGTGLVFFWVNHLTGVNYLNILLLSRQSYDDPRKISLSFSFLMVLSLALDVILGRDIDHGKERFIL